MDEGKPTNTSASLVPDEGPDRERNPIKRFLTLLGPGLITGAADDDPSGIGTYLAGGCSLWFCDLLWTALPDVALDGRGAILCAKIGMVSGWVGRRVAHSLLTQTSLSGRAGRPHR